MSPMTCPACAGKRLKPSSLAVRVQGVTIADLTGMSVTKALETVKGWKLTEREGLIGGRAVEEVRNRLEFLTGVGLEYLSLERSSATLSGGEAQRIRLATQIGSRLRGVLYVLDEPSIGLHPRDNDRLLDSLAQPSRSGQHGAGGGARRRHHRARRLRDRSGPRRGPPGRGTGGAGNAAGDRAQPQFAHRAVSVRRARDRRSQGSPHAHRPKHRDPRRDRAQSQEDRRGVSAGAVHSGDRRFRQRQIHAGE